MVAVGHRSGFAVGHADAGGSHGLLCGRFNLLEVLFNTRGRQSNRHLCRRRGKKEADSLGFFSAIIRRLTPLLVIRRALFRVFKRPPRLIKLGVDPTTLLRISQLTCPAIASPVSGLERRRSLSGGVSRMA